MPPTGLLLVALMSTRFHEPNPSTNVRQKINLVRLCGYGSRACAHLALQLLASVDAIPAGPAHSVRSPLQVVEFMTHSCRAMYPGWW
jgi:hypothetical protein